MKKIIDIFRIGGIVFGFSYLCTSCVDTGFAEIEVLQDVFKDVCVEWGVGEEAVAAEMDQYELQNMEADMMKYYDAETGTVISYLFDEDGLCASALIMKDDMASSIDKLFSGYESVGLLNGVEIYYNSQKKTFLSSYVVTKNDKQQRVIGLTKI